MGADTYILSFPGALLTRGFWVYVWRIETPKGEMLYVGRTGDSSSPKATPPYTRMGQHLGNNKNQNALRRQLKDVGVQAEECGSFELISHGPIFPEQKDMDAHRKPRDVVAAIEKQLADNLETAGYRVLNKVHCRKPLDKELWVTVKQAFIEYFPKIGDVEG